MDQNYKLITRNYSRKEGSEMFSLTITREIEVESTFFRQRAECYIAFYDVQIQLLEEMLMLGYVERDFVLQRKKGIASQLKLLMNEVEKEIESGNLTKAQAYMGISTIDSIYNRLPSAMPERRELTIKYVDEDINITTTTSNDEIKVEEVKVEETKVEETKVEEIKAEESKEETKSKVEDDVVW